MIDRGGWVSPRASGLPYVGVHWPVWPVAVRRSDGDTDVRIMHMCVYVNPAERQRPFGPTCARSWTTTPRALTRWRSSDATARTLATKASWSQRAPRRSRKRSPRTSGCIPTSRRPFSERRPGSRPRRRGRATPPRPNVRSQATAPDWPSTHVEAMLTRLTRCRGLLAAQFQHKKIAKDANAGSSNGSDGANVRRKITAFEAARQALTGLYRQCGTCVGRCSRPCATRPPQPASRHRQRLCAWRW